MRAYLRRISPLLIRVQGLGLKFRATEIEVMFAFLQILGRGGKGLGEPLLFNPA